MQTSPTANVDPSPAREADAQIAAGSDAWSRSAGMVIGSLAAIGVLFIGALVFMYFGVVQPKGTFDVVSLKVVDPAPVTPPARAEPPAPVAVAEPAAVAPSVAAPEVPLREEPRPAAIAAPEPVAARSTSPPPVVAEPAEPARSSPPGQETERRVTAAAPAPIAPALTRQKAQAPLSLAAQPLAKTAPVEVAKNSDAIAPPAPAPVPSASALQVAAAAPAPPPAGPVDPPAPVVLRPLSRPQPSFPVQALHEGVSKGSVVARLSIGTDGRVTDVAIVSSNPPRLFDRATQRALSEWRFEPISRPTTAQIELAFRAD